MLPNMSNSWICDQSGNVPLVFPSTIQPSIISCFPVSTAPIESSYAQDTTILEKLIESTRMLYDNIVKTAQHTSEMMKQQGVNWKNPALYKTSICKNWKNTGMCRYGDACWYAHGKDDVRYVPRLDLLPSYLESLQSMQAELSQNAPSVEEIPLEYFKNVPPPCLSSMSIQQATFADSCQESLSNLSFDIKNAPEVGVAPVMVAPVMVTNPLSAYWSEGDNGQVASAQACFGSSNSTILYNGYNAPVALNFDNIEEPCESESLVAKENSQVNEVTPTNRNGSFGRRMFMKSFHMFGQSYPLNRNWA